MGNRLHRLNVGIPMVYLGISLFFQAERQFRVDTRLQPQGRDHVAILRSRPTWKARPLKKPPSPVSASNPRHGEPGKEL